MTLPIPFFSATNMIHINISYKINIQKWCFIYILFFQNALNEPAEEIGTLLQQPLALGYLVSTAPTGNMPSWFWASCPHLEGVCPVFIKNALHLHSPLIQQNSDDLLQQQSTLIAHPLDSQYTTDVLRYL